MFNCRLYQEIFWFSPIQGLLWYLLILYGNHNKAWLPITRCANITSILAEKLKHSMNLLKIYVNCLKLNWPFIQTTRATTNSGDDVFTLDENEMVNDNLLPTTSSSGVFGEWGSFEMNEHHLVIKFHWGVPH